LKYICKRYEANKKIRKRKEEKKIKIEKGLGGAISAQLHKRPTVHPEPNPKGYPLTLVSPLTGGPRSSGPLLPLTDRTH
jgi:hypothetical protein